MPSGERHAANALPSSTVPSAAHPPGTAVTRSSCGLLPRGAEPSGISTDAGDATQRPTVAARGRGFLLPRPFPLPLHEAATATARATAHAAISERGNARTRSDDLEGVENPAGVRRVAVDGRECLPWPALRSPNDEVVGVRRDGRDRVGRRALAHEDAAVFAAAADRPRAAAGAGQRECDRPID